MSSTTTEGTTGTTVVLYSESFRPWFAAIVFPLRVFSEYGVVVEEDEHDRGNRTVTFGYGVGGPAKTSRLTAHSSSVANIDPSSVTFGEASVTENVTGFGGWGVRYGLLNGTWAYNAVHSGPYCEFVETVDSKRTKYRLSTNDPAAVAAMLRGETPSPMGGESA